MIPRSVVCDFKSWFWFGLGIIFSRILNKLGFWHWIHLFVWTPLKVLWDSFWFKEDDYL